MITYTLITRDLTEGQVAIVLYLFRDDEVASVTTIATVARNAAAVMLMKSRAHLHKVGVPDADEPLLRAAG